MVLIKCLQLDKCEKAIEMSEEVAWAFMDLEKTYDKVDISVLWKVLCIYGVGRRLLREVDSFYESSRACVGVANGPSEWFPVCERLRQGCVLSPWLLNMYSYGQVFGNSYNLSASILTWI